MLKLIKAPKKSDDFPKITFDKMDLMRNADGFVFGIRTRSGLMSAQCKLFWD